MLGMEFLRLVRAYGNHRPLPCYRQQLVQQIGRLSALALPCHKVPIGNVRENDIRLKILAFQGAVPQDIRLKNLVGDLPGRLFQEVPQPGGAFQGLLVGAFLVQAQQLFQLADAPPQPVFLQQRQVLRASPTASGLMSEATIRPIESGFKKPSTVSR